MDPLHSVVLTVGLFALTFLSPGPNLLVVLQSSLSAGRAAGVAAGLGVAAGDGVYAGLGLAGMSALVQVGGMLFAAVKIAGGGYLVWYGVRLLLARDRATLEAATPGARVAPGAYFRRGLLTDLANPQTVLFFASIFAVTLHAGTPLWARALAWCGIVAASVTWRVGLSSAFAHARVRRAYARAQRSLERLAGAALTLFGLRLVYEGLARR